MNFSLSNAGGGPKVTPGTKSTGGRPAGAPVGSKRQRNRSRLTFAWYSASPQSGGAFAPSGAFALLKVAPAAGSVTSAKRTWMTQGGGAPGGGGVTGGPPA